MSERRWEFVAEELWLVFGVVTLPLTALTGMVFEPVAGAIAIVGWFLLTPLFLFWGEDIATMLYGEPGEEQESAPPLDPIEELKRRYAEGKIDEEEFERRLERLITVENLDDDRVALSPENERTREFELERE